MAGDIKKTAKEIIESYDGPKIRIMEVCGTHTHEIFRLGSGTSCLKISN